MDEKRFDDLTRRLRTSTSRRTGIRALVGGIVGLGAVTRADGTDARRKPDKCHGKVRCAGECCRPGHECFLGRCQRPQNFHCEPQSSCQNDSDCSSAFYCIDRICCQTF